MLQRVCTLLYLIILQHIDICTYKHINKWLLEDLATGMNFPDDKGHQKQLVVCIENKNRNHSIN